MTFDDADPQRSRRWHETWKADPVARVLADRHYNRQKVGSPFFVPPGRSYVLRTLEGDAVWVTSWPYAEYVLHEWAGAWVNSLFRNEGPHLSSSLVLEAVAMTRHRFGEPPAKGMVTFVSEEHTRRKRDPGRCYRKAGFRVVGRTKEKGLVALQLLPEDMPEPIPPRSVIARPGKKR